MHTKFSSVEDFASRWKSGQPIYKLFTNGIKKYLYDTGTNKIFICNDIEYTLLSILQNYDNIDQIKSRLEDRFALNEIDDTMHNLNNIILEHNILSCYPSNVSFKDLSRDFIEQSCKENLNIMILEVTQSCNLRCKYCLFDDQNGLRRQHGSISMNENIAFKAIDLFFMNSKLKEEVALTFYGGEPLLKFDLIKKLVEYAKKKFKNKSVSFSLTTNATLLSEEFAEFFAINHFNLVISLDGPEKFHDEYRVFKNGTGSYSSTMRGINNLLKYYTPEMVKANISISIVFAPPFSIEKLDSISEIFSSDSPLKDANPRITFPIRGTVPVEYYEKYKDCESELYFIDWAFPKYFESYPDVKDINPLIKFIMQDALLGLQKRQYQNKSNINIIPLNACCLPSQRRIFVSADGKLNLCERILEAPTIGSIKSGVDYDALYENYIYDYSKESIKQCSSCWANRLCGICYINGFSEGELSIDSKNIHCNQIKNLNEKKLNAYTKLLEKDINGLDYLSEMIVI